MHSTDLQEVLWLGYFQKLFWWTELKPHSKSSTNFQKTCETEIIKYETTISYLNLTPNASFKYRTKGYCVKKWEKYKKRQNYFVITAVGNRQLGWRSVTNDEVKYQMRGNMFVENQMWIIFLSCYHFNIFQANLRMSFRKIGVWLSSYNTFRRTLVLNISIEI